MITMFTRMDEIMIEIPDVEKPDPNAAAAVQELLGGKFGEMSTLNNYLYQSFNFRSKDKLKPFYDLVMSITAEELGHVELVSHAVNKCLRGSTAYKKPDSTPLAAVKDARLSYHFLAGAQGPCRSIRWAIHGPEPMCSTAATSWKISCITSSWSAGPEPIK